MQGDDQARRNALSAQALDGGLGPRRVLTRALQGAGPADVVQLARAVDGDADLDLVLMEHPHVVVVDEHAVGLDPVGAPPLKPPRPQRLEVLLSDQQGLAAEDGEGTALALHRRLHGLEVVGARDVVGVAYRILVAVLALDVAGNAGRTQLDRHQAPQCRRSAMIRLTSVVPPRRPPSSATRARC